MLDSVLFVADFAAHLLFLRYKPSSDPIELVLCLKTAGLDEADVIVEFSVLVVELFNREFSE